VTAASVFGLPLRSRMHPLRIIVQPTPRPRSSVVLHGKGQYMPVEVAQEERDSSGSPRCIVTTLSTCIAVLLTAAFAALAAARAATTAVDDAWPDKLPCVIERRNNLTTDEFRSFFDSGRPVVFARSSGGFAELTAREPLMRSFGSLHIKARSPTPSRYGQTKQMTLASYITDLCDNDTHAGGLWQGDYVGDDATWDALLARYTPVESMGGSYDLETERDRKNFGVAGRGSGAFWHRHGPALSHTLVGRKAWFVYPLGVVPPGQWHDASAVAWYRSVFRSLEEERRPMTCVLDAGDVLFVPTSWYHMTVNVARYTAFMTVFG